jgi:hypothetical protein
MSCFHARRPGTPGRRPCDLAPAAALLVLAPILVGCGEDPPPECSRAPEGEFRFETDTPETTRFTGTLQDATHYVGEPSWEYRFRTNGNRNIQVVVPEIGPAAPVEEGQVYTVEAVTAGRDPHDSFGMRITDAAGLRFMAVADWTPGYSVFVPGATQQGYLLQGTERIVVSVSDPGCEPEPLQDNTQDYLLLRNRTLQFTIQGVGSVELFHGQTATLGTWVLHVHKAMEVRIKNPGLIQNQLSFSVERAGLRS